MLHREALRRFRLAAASITRIVWSATQRGALAFENADLYFCHIQPAGVGRRVVVFGPAQQVGGGLGAEPLLETAAQMAVEAVQHQADLADFIVSAVRHAPDKAAEISLSAPLRDLRMAFPVVRLDGDEDIAGFGSYGHVQICCKACGKAFTS